MARLVIVTRRDKVGRHFVIPSTSLGFLHGKQSQKSWNGESTKKEVYPNLPTSCRPRPQSKKSFSKRQPDHPGGGICRRLPCLASPARKMGRPALSCKMDTEKPHYRPRESLYPGTCFVDELGLQGWLDEDERPIKTLGVRVADRREYAVRRHLTGTGSHFGSNTTGRPVGRTSVHLPIPSN